ncbi:DUF6349 family protein [Streptomyces scabiei]|uniref:DUF6349 family protein n=1 Tax=Streptomyces scabiei TaxID=1930 RepID=UPI0039082F38
MGIRSGAIARQRPFTTVRNARREVLRQMWFIEYGDPGVTTQLGPPPEPSLHHTATSMFKAVADARWIHRGPASPAPGEPPTDRAACLSGPGHRDHRGMLGLARLAFMPFGSGVCMRRLQRRLRCKQCRPSTEPRR